MNLYLMCFVSVRHSNKVCITTRYFVPPCLYTSDLAGWQQQALRILVSELKLVNNSNSKLSERSGESNFPPPFLPLKKCERIF